MNCTIWNYNFIIIVQPNDVDLVDTNGNSALHVAVEKGSLSIANVLLAPPR